MSGACGQEALYGMLRACPECADILLWRCGLTSVKENTSSSSATQQIYIRHANTTMRELLHTDPCVNV